MLGLMVYDLLCVGCHSDCKLCELLQEHRKNLHLRSDFMSYVKRKQAAMPF